LPAIDSIAMRIVPPSYLMNRRAASEGESRTGEIEALAGSTAQLVLHANQPLASVRVELLTTSREPMQVLSASISHADPTVAQLKFPVDFDGYWRAHLTSATTHLAQGDPPLWPIRAYPDA